MAFASFGTWRRATANADDAVNAKNAGRNGVLAGGIVDLSAGETSGTTRRKQGSSASRGRDRRDGAERLDAEGLSVLERALELEPRNVATICALSQELQALPAFGEEAQPERVRELLLLARERARRGSTARATACCNWQHPCLRLRAQRAHQVPLS